jgi:hypothetical protein
MTNTAAAATSDLSRLSWRKDGEFQLATDHRCLYIRESAGAIASGVIFCLLIVPSAGWLGITTLRTSTAVGELAFGALMLLVASVFTYIPWTFMRKGRWMVTFDRGEPGVPGEIRYRQNRLPVHQVRSLSTRGVGGKMPRSTVVAELHDGRHEALGPVSVQAWATHYGQHAASWMGIPFRPSSS